MHDQGTAALSVVTKQQVHDFWDEASCGEGLFLETRDKNGYEEELRRRYEIEPYILDFADFEGARGLDVLEIGVGLGADHQMFAQAGANLTGIDLTQRAIDHVRRRLALNGLHSELERSDAENLSFPDNSFDLVYSWGVIHHSPNTLKAAHEILRVLRPGGRFKVMIYQKYSVLGLMLWLRYGLARWRPLMPLSEIYSRYLESPGTKAYTPDEARALFADAINVKIESALTQGDLLHSSAGQRHEGAVLNIARAVWPRRLITKLFPNRGLFLLVSGEKKTA